MLIAHAVFPALALFTLSGCCGEVISVDTPVRWHTSSLPTLRIVNHTGVTLDLLDPGWPTPPIPVGTLAPGDAADFPLELVAVRRLRELRPVPGRYGLHPQSSPTLLIEPPMDSDHTVWPLRMEGPDAVMLIRMPGEEPWTLRLDVGSCLGADSSAFAPLPPIEVVIRSGDDLAEPIPLCR